jgi:hypothetical protein
VGIPASANQAPASAGVDFLVGLLSAISDSNVTAQSPKGQVLDSAKQLGANARSLAGTDSAGALAADDSVGARGRTPTAGVAASARKPTPGTRMSEFASTVSTSAGQNPPLATISNPRASALGTVADGTASRSAAPMAGKPQPGASGAQHEQPSSFWLAGQVTNPKETAIEKPAVLLRALPSAPENANFPAHPSAAQPGSEAATSGDTTQEAGWTEISAETGSDTSSTSTAARPVTPSMAPAEGLTAAASTTILRSESPTSSADPIAEENSGDAGPGQPGTSGGRFQQSGGESPGADAHAADKGPNAEPATSNASGPAVPMFDRQVAASSSPSGSGANATTTETLAATLPPDRLDSRGPLQNLVYRVDDGTNGQYAVRFRQTPNALNVEISATNSSAVYNLAKGAPALAASLADVGWDLKAPSLSTPTTLSISAQPAQSQGERPNDSEPAPLLSTPNETLGRTDHNPSTDAQLRPPPHSDSGQRAPASNQSEEGHAPDGRAQHREDGRSDSRGNARQRPQDRRRRAAAWSQSLSPSIAAISSGASPAEPSTNGATRTQFNR